MNLLIVDDDVCSTDGIAASMNWIDLQIDHVYKAYSMQQAQKIYEETTIDILLCDIEMPRGTGIELVEWVREQNYHSVCIFLTCFPRFEYASSAVRLQMFDYILKPCEYAVLAEILRRAVGKVREDTAKRKKQEHGEYWKTEYLRLVTDFWNNLVMGTIPPQRSSIRQKLVRHHLDPSMADREYSYLLIRTAPDEDLSTWSDDLWQYAVTNIIAELLQGGTILFLKPDFLIILPKNDDSDPSAFADACKNLVQTLRNTLPAEFFGYYTQPFAIENTKRIVQELKNDAQTFYVPDSTAFEHNASYHALPPLSIQDSNWQNALLNYNTDLIFDEVQTYLMSAGPECPAERKSLEMIYHHLSSVIYSILGAHQLPVYQPFSSGSGQQAFNSIADFLLWTQDVLENAVALLSAQEPSSALIDKLTGYIRENLNEDLSRNQLVQLVHVHPDYLSTLFRQKKGMPLSEYITQERIRAAKNLLRTTELPIKEIAIRTGYQSISYFSKQFKRIESITPLAYRNDRNK